MSVHFSNAQNINWTSLEKNQNDQIYLNFGYDFGLTTQLGYGHQLNMNRPIIITADYSFPMGKNLVDDFKIRLGGQISIFQKEEFVLSAKAYGIFRRHETKLVRMINFGSELAAIFGYYKQSWHIAAEFGFDKAISTHLKHSSVMEENYPAITNGWFEATGGNFIFGIQMSKRMRKKFEVSLRLGATSAQAKDENAILPYYAQLGINYKLN